MTITLVTRTPTGLIRVPVAGTDAATLTDTGSATNATLYPNEPAGAVALLSSPLAFDFDNLAGTTPETDVQPFTEVTLSGWADTITDATAPRNPSKVGRLHITNTSASAPTGGSSIIRLFSYNKLDPSPTIVEWYFSFYFKMVPNLTDPIICVQGIKFFNNWGATDTNIFILEPTNAATGAGPYGFQYLHEAPQTFVDGVQKHIVKDTWYHVETTINYSTHRYRIWVDETLRGDGYNNTDPPEQPDRFSWNFVYGGGPMQEPGLSSNQDWYIYLDEMYASYTT